MCILCDIAKDIEKAEQVVEILTENDSEANKHLIEYWQDWILKKKEEFKKIKEESDGNIFQDIFPFAELTTIKLPIGDEDGNSENRD